MAHVRRGDDSAQDVDPAGRRRYEATHQIPHRRRRRARRRGYLMATSIKQTGICYLHADRAGGEAPADPSFWNAA